MALRYNDEWLQAWHEAINESAAYAAAASKWEWPVLLKVEDEPGLRFYLDLKKGQCLEARRAADTDFEGEVYVLSAPKAVWDSLLDAEMEPISAVMRGKLKLEQGKLSRLLGQVKAAQELVQCARGLEQGNETIPQTGDDMAPAATTPPQNGFRSLQPFEQEFPLRLYQKAKKLGIWNPADIDFSQDKKDWQGLNELEREVLLHLTTLFQGGEEAVTMDILPLMLCVARERRIEEELYLSTFLFEEAKHTEFFRLFLDEVCGEQPDLSRFHDAAYNRLFAEALPAAMSVLLEDPSAQNQVKASATYNMIVEGVLAETGYQAYYSMLQRNDIMPGLRSGIARLKQDESRHIAYGLYFIARHIGQDPALEKVLFSTMESLFSDAIAVIEAIFTRYEVMPFGLKKEEFIDYARQQFTSRMERLERGRVGELPE